MSVYCAVMNIAQQMLNNLCKGRQKKEVAAMIGVSPAFIGAVLCGRKKPGPKILKYLGLEAYETYRRKRRRPRVVAAAATPTPALTEPV